MNSISHLEKIRFEKADAIVLVECPHESGIPMFAYVKVDKAGYERLIEAYESGTVGKFADYGEVILFGQGEPDEATRQFIASIEL